MASCNLFQGSWVYDDALPMYDTAGCPFVEPEFDCQKYGRPDKAYLKYRWRPASCELPRYAAQPVLAPQPAECCAAGANKKWRVQRPPAVPLLPMMLMRTYRFNGQDLLSRWKGKKILFVGDSISLNQWESLACMLRAAAPASRVAYARGNPVSSVTFQVRTRTIRSYCTCMLALVRFHLALF
ncbi:hypothetical protein U9M48_018225 [Paspalum notatum var. saurae]|uniref:Trichome birefringence-like N-terminal domain-containing protein n=1 Tax=Paspalum notatum var. saurae TaxID=547442 RepID=A0AAQ3T9L6_PASNO